MKYTREQIQDTIERLGYKYFTGDNYDVNIIGIRNSDTNGKVTNHKSKLSTRTVFFTKQTYFYL